MIQGKNIVITGIQSWDLDIGSNCKNIALEFAKHNKVLYVNPPLDRITIIKHQKKANMSKRIEVVKGKKNQLTQVEENLWCLTPAIILESINQIPIKWLFNILNKLNNKRFSKAINQAIRAIKFDDFILFTDSDMFRSFYLKEMLQPQFCAYYIRDNLVEVNYWKRHGERLEPHMIAKSDAVFTNSTYLNDYAKKYNPLSYFIGQGCETEMYHPQNTYLRPEDMRGLLQPLIGYTGALNSVRLSLNIIQHIAKNNPRWSIVLIGPEDEDFKKSDLHNLPNVYFFGKKKPEELAAYVKCFDVAINPQALNPITIGNYPRKIDEYLAMGKPTVATRTRAMDYFSRYCYLAQSGGEFSKAIAQALEEDTLEKQRARMQFAQSHTWANSVNEIYKNLILN